MNVWRRARRAKAEAAAAEADALKAREDAEQRRDMVTHGIVPRVDEVVAALQLHRVTNHTEPMVAHALAAPRLRAQR